MEAKYPNSWEFLNGLTESKLWEFAAALGNKSDRLKSKIQYKGLDLDMNRRHLHCNRNPKVLSNESAGQGFRNLVFGIINHPIAHQIPSYSSTNPIDQNPVSAPIPVGIMNPPVIDQNPIVEYHQRQQQFLHYSASQLNDAMVLRPDLMLNDGAGMISYIPEPSLEYCHHYPATPPILPAASLRLPPTMAPPLPADSPDFDDIFSVSGEQSMEYVLNAQCR